jgi:hypothetical protein
VRHACGEGSLLVRVAPGGQAATGPRLPLPAVLDRDSRLAENMNAILRRLLLVVALLFSQHAAMLHGLAHAEHDLALAGQQEGQAPALDHGLDTCAAFGALAQALGSAGRLQAPSCVQAGAPSASFFTVSAVTRIGFDSRAPPLSA